MYPGFGYSPIVWWDDDHYAMWYIGSLDEIMVIERAISNDEVCYLYADVADATWCPSTYNDTNTSYAIVTCASGSTSDLLSDNDSLLVWLRLEADDTGNVPDYAIDSSGNGYHGIWRNVYTMADGLESSGSYSVQLNPVSTTSYYEYYSGTDVAEYASAIELGVLPLQQATFCAWVYVTSFAGYPILFSNGLDDNQYYRYQSSILRYASFEFGFFGSGDGRLYIYGYGADGNRYNRGTTTAIVASTDVHVCGAVGNGEAKIWVNGMSMELSSIYDDDGDTTLPNELWQNDQSYMIANIRDYGYAANSGLQGQIDDVRVYNSVLTDESVLSIWRCGALTAPYLSDGVSTKTVYTIAGGSLLSLYTLPFLFVVGYDLTAPTVTMSTSVTWITLTSAYGTPWTVSILPPTTTIADTYNATFTATNEFGETISAVLTVQVVTLTTPDNTSTWE
jgi:hypothetical protein